MTDIEVLLPDGQWEAWLREASANHPDVRLVLRDADSAAQALAGLRAAMLHVECANGVLVRRYVAAGVPVVLLTTKSSSQPKAYEAIQAGATHVFKIDADAHGMRGALRRALPLLRQPPDGAVADTPPPEAAVQTGSPSSPLSAPVIAIGASAGGPKALNQVLAALPADLNAAVVVVVHVEPGQDSGLREFLVARCNLPIATATSAAPLQAGRVTLGTAGQHLEIDSQGRLVLLPRQHDDVFCPSVDRLFTSLARSRAGGVAALLTGMGRDGARGLLALREAGWYTLAQDAASSAVYGMPREALELGAVCDVVPLPSIAPALISRLAAMHPSGDGGARLPPPCPHALAATQRPIRRRTSS